MSWSYNLHVSVYDIFVITMHMAYKKNKKVVLLTKYVINHIGLVNNDFVIQDE